MKFVFTLPGWYLGGFVTFCRNLSQGLRTRGHSVALLVLPNAGLNPSVPEGLFDQCRIVPRGFGPLRRHIRNVARAINDLEPDVLVLNDSPYAMAALPCIDTRVSRLVVLHSVAPEEIELSLVNSQWWDRAVAVSECVAGALSEKIPASRIGTCPVGVELPTDSEEGPPRQVSGPLRIVTAGRVVVYQKRMDRLPVIAQLLAERRVDFHWTVLGDGEYLPNLQEQLKCLGLQSRFELLGSVPPSVLASVLDGAQVLVMPSDCEGMPQALLEAMAHGLVPVVSRIQGSTTSVVEHRASGYLCEASQPVDFATALAELAANPELRQNMAGRAVDRISRHFSLEAFTKRFLAHVLETQATAKARIAALPVPACVPGRHSLRCLGFWRSLRHQTLGQIKRRVLARRRGLAAPEHSLPVSI